MQDSNNYNYILESLDIDNYIDYQIAQMFFANSDWPSNNVKLWRPNNANGKWRWIFYDLDAGLIDYNKNMFIHCMNTDESIGWPNSPKATFLFRNLIKTFNLF